MRGRGGIGAGVGVGDSTVGTECERANCNKGALGIGRRSKGVLLEVMTGGSGEGEWPFQCISWKPGLYGRRL